MFQHFRIEKRILQEINREMSARRNVLAGRRLVMVFCIVSALQPPHVAAAPQNPFEAGAAGALAVASSVAEMLQNGARAEHEGGFETPFFSVHSRKEVGMGQVMRRRNDDSSEEDSDEYRRRKRAVAPLVRPSANEAPHSHLLRNKRSPCHSMRPSTSTGGGGDVEEVEEARRRSARMQARKRSATSKKTKARKAKTSAKNAKKSRRRRQTEVDDLEGNMQNMSKQLGNHVGQFSEKVRGIFESILNAMNEVMQQMTRKFSGGKGMPNDAESI